MKSRSETGFSAVLFSAISRAVILLLAVWIFAVGRLGFSESFDGRPAQAELETTVTKGMACARGVNERCYATQTTTNPTYSVSPPDFAGTNGGWYLDNDLMTNLDLKAKALVPCYADDDTVYDGTPEIVMLTVTGLWAQLQIGDHVSEFTGTPAMGTNAATYGDYPWRIYSESLEERYDVLNALIFIVIPPTLELYSRSSYAHGSATWAAELAQVEGDFNTASFQSGIPSPFNSGSYYAATYGSSSGYRVSIIRTTGSVHSVVSPTLSSEITGEAEVYLKGGVEPGFVYVWDENGVAEFDSPGIWNRVSTVQLEYQTVATYSLPDISGLPTACADPFLSTNDTAYTGFQGLESKTVFNWDFQYCK